MIHGGTLLLPHRFINRNPIPFSSTQRHAILTHKRKGCDPKRKKNRRRRASDEHFNEMQ